MGDELRVRLYRQAPLPEADLRVEEREATEGPAPGEVRLRVEACGVCRTDLHIVEGDVPAHRLPVTLGHQVVGRVEAVGPGVALAPGTRVGVGWLASACGTCPACRSGRENLCPEARFTGYDTDGGYAATMTARADFTYPLPDALGDAAAVAPLLCGGVIGYRALRLAGVLDRPGESVAQPIESEAGRPIRHLLLIGFGNSASITLQVARGLGWECHVATRSETHRAVARELGASWVGEEPAPDSADAAVIFAPAGRLVPVALRAVVPGGSVACAGITMTDIPSFPYRLLYRERVLRSVANATRRDAIELLELAARFGLRSEVEMFPLREARSALGRLAASELRASAVLVA